MNKVVFFTKYTMKGPNSRYRSYQYKSYFEKDFQVEYFPFFNDLYLELLFKNKKTNKIILFRCLIKRILDVLKVIGKKKLIVIEYELIPFFPSIFECIFNLFNVKYILDFDDAIFHNYDNSNNFLIRFLFKNKIRNISKNAAHIITGSPYLTSYFKKFNSHVSEIPTSINFSEYKKHNEYHLNSRIIIGWLGSKTTSHNLLLVKNVINTIKYKYPNIIFKFCGFDESFKRHFNMNNIELIEWSPTNELIFLNQINIGIMPLYDDLFNRGKCGFKLIQYMAMGKPTISSPLVANVKIDRGNGNLFAVSENDWVNCICLIISNLDKYDKIGIQNSRTIAENYSIEINYHKYINIFNQIILK